MVRASVRCRRLSFLFCPVRKYVFLCRVLLSEQNKDISGRLRTTQERHANFHSRPTERGGVDVAESTLLGQNTPDTEPCMRHCD